MTAADLLAAVVERLEAAQIPYMVAGSVASSFHGEPRSTRDIDVVIDPDDTRLQRLVDSFEPDRFYVGDAMEALRRRDQFNVIDTVTGWKVDLIIRKERGFSREEFARRRTVIVLGVPTSLATAEDTILAKLEWAEAGASERQLDDVVGILEVSKDVVDEEYLHRWARELGVSELLERARARGHEAEHW